MLTRASLAEVFNGKTFEEACQLGYMYCMLGYAIDVRKAMALGTEYRVWAEKSNKVLIEVDDNLQVKRFYKREGAFVDHIDLN